MQPRFTVERAGQAGGQAVSTPRGLRIAACAVAALCTHVPAPACAQAAEPERAVILFVTECAQPALDVDEVERVLCAALGPDRRACVRRPASEAIQLPDAPALFLDACGGDGAVVARSRGAGGAATEHVLDLSDIAALARPRTVAMALAELHDAGLGGEAEPDAPPPAPPPTTTAATAIPEPIERPPPLLAATAGDEPTDAAPRGWRAAVVARATDRAMVLFGLALGARFGPLHAELVAAANSRSDPLGEALVGFAVIAAAYDAVVLGDTVALALRPRFELGAALATGDGAELQPPRSSVGEEALPPEPQRARGHTELALQAAALAEVEGSVAITSATRLALTLCIGFAQGLDAVADNRSLGSTGGLTLGAALAFSLQL